VANNECPSDMWQIVNVQSKAWCIIKSPQWLSVELLPSMDWIILEVDKFIVPVDDSLPKSKISLVKKILYNNGNISEYKIIKEQTD
jgi:hypothetical protein